VEGQGLALTIKGLEQDWLAQCQFKGLGGVSFFLQHGSSVRWHFKSQLDLTTSVVHRYKIADKRR